LLRADGKRDLLQRVQTAVAVGEHCAQIAHI
jgi:hypothetical protein